MIPREPRLPCIFIYINFKKDCFILNFNMSKFNNGKVIGYGFPPKVAADQADGG